MSLKVKIIPIMTDNYVFVITDDETQETAVVDPGIAEPVIEYLQKENLRPKYILNTHHHYDHVDGILQVKEAFPKCKVLASEYDKGRIPGFDSSVGDGDEIQLGQSKAQVISIPGHTLGHIAYHFADDNKLFSGDTLFAMGCGRLFEGTPEQMLESLKKLTALPTETQVYCTHEYTEYNSRFALTIDPENPELQERASQVSKMRAQGAITIPTNIDLELKTNPMLRSHIPEVQKQMETSDELSTFTKIRKLRDSF